jgi:hypothetical protein
MPSNSVNFFSYVVKENVEGIRALLGRRKLLYEDAILQGYELCVQTVDQVSDLVPPGSELPISPRELLAKTYPPDYELYTIRPRTGATVAGKIWYISPNEYEYWREYELIDYGLSGDITAKAITENGDVITVQTYGLISNTANISKVIDSSYMRENIPTQKKLQHKRKIRMDYIKRKSQSK